MSVSCASWNLHSPTSCVQSAGSRSKLTFGPYFSCIPSVGCLFEEQCFLCSGIINIIINIPHGIRSLERVSSALNTLCKLSHLKLTTPLCCSQGKYYAQVTDGELRLGTVQHANIRSEIQNYATKTSKSVFFSLPQPCPQCNFLSEWVRAPLNLTVGSPNVIFSLKKETFIVV